MVSFFRDSSPVRSSSVAKNSPQLTIDRHAIGDVQGVLGCGSNCKGVRRGGYLLWCRKSSNEFCTFVEFGLVKRPTRRVLDASAQKTSIVHVVCEVIHRVHGVVLLVFAVFGCDLVL